MSTKKFNKMVDEAAAIFADGLDNAIEQAGILANTVNNTAEGSETAQNDTKSTITTKDTTDNEKAVKIDLKPSNDNDNAKIETMQTAEAIKIIEDTEKQISQYNESLPKSITAAFNTLKGKMLLITATAEQIAQYNETMLKRQTAIYEAMTAYDEKLEKAEASKKEKEEKASQPKLTKFEKAQKKFNDLMDGMTAEESDILNLTISNNNYTIKNLLTDFENGKIIIPTIQRGLVWSNDQILKLYDSLLKKYPIPQLVVINGKLMDGQQRTNAIIRICDYLKSKGEDGKAQLETIESRFIPVMEVTGNLSSTQEIAVMDKLNNGTLYSKAVKVRNTMQATTIDNYSKIKAHNAIKHITAEARKQAINLDKQGQLDTLSTYILAVSKAVKSIACDMSTCKAVTESNEYTEADMKAIYIKLDKVSEVVNGIESARASGKFIANIYNLNTLASIVYAVFKLNTDSKKIVDNLVKAYTNKDGKHCGTMQNDRWAMSTKSSGSGGENIKIRADILNK